MTARPLPGAHILSALAVSLGLCGAVLAAPRAAAALDTGDSAPDFSLTSLDGKPVALSALRGKVVLLDFWASWCAPCKEEMPFLESLHRRYAKQGLVIVGVSVDEDRDKAKKFISNLKITFPVVHDEKHGVAESYKPPRMPTSLVIGRDGKVRFVHAGYRADDAKKIEQEINQLLR